MYSVEAKDGCLTCLTLVILEPIPKTNVKSFIELSKHTWKKSKIQDTDEIEKIKPNHPGWT